MGAFTIVALAQEGEVSRNALTQCHLDLKNEFYERVKERGGIPDVGTRLRAGITRLKKTITSKNVELRKFRADVPALVCVVNQLTFENQQLREAITIPSANVVPFHRRTD